MERDDLLRAVGLEVRPRESTDVVDVIHAVDFSGHAVGPTVGVVDAINRQAGQVPGIDVCAQVAGLPAEGTCAVVGERRGDGGCHWAAS